MIRFLLRNERFNPEEDAVPVVRHFTIDDDLAAVEVALRAGGCGNGGYDRTLFVGVEVLDRPASTENTGTALLPREFSYRVHRMLGDVATRYKRTREARVAEKRICEAMISAYEEATDGDRLPDGDGHDEKIVVAMLQAAMITAGREVNNAAGPFV